MRKQRADYRQLRHFWRSSYAILSALLVLVFALTLVQTPVVHGAEVTVLDGDVAGLKRAIDNANANPGPDIINLVANGTYELTVRDNGDPSDHPSGLPVITSEIIFNGNGATIMRSHVQNTPLFRIFKLGDDADVMMNDLTVSNGRTGLSGSGGGIFLDKGSRLIANNCTFEGHTSDFSSGGAFDIAAGGYAELTECVVDGNIAVIGGGFLNSGTLVINGGEVSRNSATNSAGGIFNNAGGRLILDGVLLEGNFAQLDAGALYSERAGNLKIIDTRFINNESLRFGGALELVSLSGSHNVLMRGVTFDGNKSNHGAALYCRGNSDYTITIGGASYFVNNIAAGSGGAISNEGCTIFVVNTRINQNSAPLGGGVFNLRGEVNMTNVRSKNNDATSLGGGAYNQDGSMTINASIFDGNTAGDAGGSGYNEGVGATLVINDTSMINGKAPVGGNLAPSLSSVTEVNRSLIADGEAADAFGFGVGGNIFIDVGTLIIENSTISGGNSDSGGNIFVSGDLTMNHVTVAEGIAPVSSGSNFILANGDVSIENSIIANGLNENCLSFGGLSSFTVNFTVDSDGTCIPGGTGTGNLLNIDPELGSLKNNGGPTLTHAPFLGSAVIESANPLSAMAIDQRGEPRPRGQFNDMGAVEIEEADFSVKIMDSPDPTIIGQDVTYSIEITNNGPGASRSILQHRVPTGMTLQSLSTTHGGCTTPSVKRVECRITKIIAGEIGLVEITYTPTTAGDKTIRVKLDSERPDPDMGNNVARQVTTVN